LGICQRGEVPCPDDGEYCTGEESCDEENKICLSTGDPCEPEGLVCDEESNICRPSPECVVDEDCDDDGLFCNGDEICVDGSCDHSGDPCPEGTTCFEENDECRPIAIPNVLTEPEPVFQSLWIPLPVLLNITAKDGAKFDVTSSVIFAPNAILALPLVISEEEIIAMGLIMPQWLTGPIASEEDGDIDVTVITGSQEAPGTIEVQLLPFFLDEDKAILE
jgi:hypothetical protein